MIDLKKAADNLILFIKMEQKHKQDWLDHKKVKSASKISMKKKHSDEWFDLKKKYAEQMGHGIKPELFLVDKLNEMIKIHERQKDEWKELCDSNHKKSADIAQAHATELDNFKKTITS